MASELLAKIWFEEEGGVWMIRSEECSPGYLRQSISSTTTEPSCSCEETSKLPISKSEVKLVHTSVQYQINNVQDAMDGQNAQVLTGKANGTTMPVKIFCSHGSHVIFLEEVRRKYNRYTLKSKSTFKNALEEYRTLPVKLVRCGRKPWKPVSVFHASECDRLNWTLLTEARLKFARANILQVDKPCGVGGACDDVREHRTENNGAVQNLKPSLPSEHETVVREKSKKHSDTVMRRGNDTPLSFKQPINIDINKCTVDESARSPKQQQLHGRVRSVTERKPLHQHERARSVTEVSLNTQRQNIKNENRSATISRKEYKNTNGQEYKIERDNVVLHFGSPVMNKRKISVEKDNSMVRLNSPSSRDDTALPLTTPIIEKDDIDFGCSPPLSRRRKSSDKKESRKAKAEKNESKDKENKKITWFTKSESKTKTNDNVSSANTTTADIKSKFKKQHRKSKSVMVSPTYLTSNSQEKVGTTRKSTLTRKASLGSSPKEKSEKPSLFRRFYGSPHTEKKLEPTSDELITSPQKRTRRYTQPVGDVQKEFIKELKGKLDKYSSEHTINTSNEPNEKVVWNMHI